MGATIRKLAGQQVFYEFRQLRLAQRIIGFDGVAAHRLGDHVLSKPEPRALRVCIPEVVNNIVEQLRRILASDESRKRVHFERTPTEMLQSYPCSFEHLLMPGDPVGVPRTELQSDRQK